MGILSCKFGDGGFGEKNTSLRPCLLKHIPRKFQGNPHWEKSAVLGVWEGLGVQG